jgi:hypothetical protein
MSDGLSIGFIKQLSKADQFLFWCHLSAQCSADLGTYRFPLFPLQKLGTRIAPSFTGINKEIVAAKCLVQAFNNTHRIGRATHTLHFLPLLIAMIGTGEHIPMLLSFDDKLAEKGRYVSILRQQVMEADNDNGPDERPDDTGQANAML